jgi:hypothetical protein
MWFSAHPNSHSLNAGFPTIGSRLRKTFAAVTQLFVITFNAFAESRAHRAMIEAELYGNRYVHRSKNDDDLPVIRKGDMA